MTKPAKHVMPAVIETEQNLLELDSALDLLSLSIYHQIIQDFVQFLPSICWHSVFYHIFDSNLLIMSVI